MSKIKQVKVKCQKCGKEINATIFESINTKYSKDVAREIISGELFNLKCNKCGFIHHLEYDVLYHDLKHGAMIWVVHDNSEDYSKKIAELKSLDDVTGYNMTRIVNNMQELREKVTCLENNKDDRVIELCKTQIFGSALNQHPNFKTKDIFYTRDSQKDYVVLYDADGEKLCSEITDELYSYMYDEYYGSQYAHSAEESFAIVNQEWALKIFVSIREPSAKKDNPIKDTQSKFSENIIDENYPICPKCKQLLPKDSNFCHYCGTALTKDNTITSTEIISSDNTNKVYKTFDNIHARGSIKDKAKKVFKLLAIVTVIIFLIFGIEKIIIPEFNYNQALQILNDGKYVEAIEAFENLGDYKDSNSMLNEAKYQFVLNNKNNDNVITFNYLKELKKIKYKNSQSIYNYLYDWKITVYAINTMAEDNTTTTRTFSSDTDIYLTFKLTGGKPNDSTKVILETRYPDGSKSKEAINNKKLIDGYNGIIHYPGGTYGHPYYGKTGDMIFRFYDSSLDLIGNAAITITY